MGPTALATRHADLRARGLDLDCPCVTPILFVPNISPGQYLSINEMGTGRPANVWQVAVFDSGADVTLVSQGYADRNGLAYGGDSMPINTAGGERTETLGALHHPLEFWLAKDTPYACRAVAPVQVVADADHLYDIIVSMELIVQWSAMVDPSNNIMTFRPDFWTKGDRNRCSVLPMFIQDREEAVAAAA
jgi:hypothetical protein